MPAGRTATGPAISQTTRWSLTKMLTRCGPLMSRSLKLRVGVCACVCACVPFPPSLPPSVFLSVFMSVLSVFLSVCRSVCVCLSVFVCLCVSLSVSLSVSVSVPLCLSVSLCICVWVFSEDHWRQARGAERSRIDQIDPRGMDWQL